MAADWDLFVDDDLPSWYADAACQDVDPDLFFPEGKGVRFTAALDVCASCPVRAACLQYALDEGFVEGVWGGATPDERKRLRRAREAA